MSQIDFEIVPDLAILKVGLMRQIGVDCVAYSVVNENNEKRQIIVSIHDEN
jgi:hypothetical protein